MGRNRLRIATLNCSSLRGAVNITRFTDWLHRSPSVSIIFLQETRLSAEDWLDKSRLPPFSTFHIVYSSAYESERDFDGGVAILIRKSFLPFFDVTPLWDSPGRALRLVLPSLHLDLLNVYFPSGNPPSQKAFTLAIKEHLALHPPQLNSHTFVLGGDFNFVHNPSLDRLGHITHHDPVGSHFSEHLCVQWHLRDLFRDQNPSLKQYTFLRGASSSRLDRFYVSSPSLDSARVFMGSGQYFFVDHRPVFLDLSHRHSSPQPSGGGGPPRVRLLFLSKKVPACAHLPTFEAWLKQSLSSYPRDPTLLFSWWSLFKKRLASYCAFLNRSVKNSLPPPICHDTKKELDDLWAAFDQGDASVLPKIQAQNKLQAQQLATYTAAHTARHRRDFIHTGERPSPFLSAKLTSKKRSYIPPLRAEGRDDLVPPSSEHANLVINHWAKVATEKSPNPAARTPILQAVRDAQPHDGPGPLSALTNPIVSVSEILSALNLSPSGRSPGPDGIPVEFYRRYKTLFLPFFAFLFTKLLSVSFDLFPDDFNRGLLITIFKSGDPHSPSNYRPITLLNVDYRLLAKVLASRLSSPLSRVIGFEQTAFLPSRRLGDSVLFYQSVDALLRFEKRNALLVLCDFEKAYDTVSRSFLYSVMDATGFSSFIPLVQRLYKSASTSAFINGFTSFPLEFTAGVRQGCPLSPLIYLFVAHALHSFLRSSQLGIKFDLISPSSWTFETQSTLFSSSQYADDTPVLLPSLSSLPFFRSTMEKFEKASGQRLNLHKTSYLNIGLPRSLPPSHSGFSLAPISSQCKLLGVPLFPPSHDFWANKVTDIQSSLDKIATWSLSSFGRCFSVNSYTFSKIFHSAEFLPLPPQVFFQQVDAAVSRLVDRGHKQQASRLRLEFFSIPVQEGGFGLLPLKSSILARQASWVFRFFLHPELPWCRLWYTLFLRLFPGHHIAHLLPFSPIFSSTILPRLPAPMHRCFSALFSIFPSLTPSVRSFAPAPCCLSLPLFFSPWFPLPPDLLQLSDRAEIPLFNKRFPFIFSLRHLAQATHLVPNFMKPPLSVSLPPTWEFPDHLPRFSTSLTLYLNGAQPPSRDTFSRQVFFRNLTRFYRSDPVSFTLLSFGLDAISSGSPPELFSPFDAISLLLKNTSFASDSASTFNFSLLSTSVRRMTLFHFTSSWSKPDSTPASRISSFVSLAFSPNPPPPSSVDLFKKKIRLLSKIRWDNFHLSFFWRLFLNGIATSDHQGFSKLVCLCPDSPARSRSHSFWSCPLAVRVRSSLSSVLQEAGLPSAFERHHLWLCISPDSRAIPTFFWSVLSLSALVAMEKGRTQVARTQLSKTDLHFSTLEEQASQTFFDLLHDFSLNALVPNRQRKLLQEDTFRALFATRPPQQRLMDPAEPP